MRIVVCLKQVLDPATIRVSSRGDLDTRDGVLITNPADLCALEEALALKDTQGAQIIALTLGQPEAADVLHEALAMGADRAVLLCDPLFAGSDAAGVSYALARAVTTIGDVALVLAGARACDDGSGQVGPRLAELLAWPQITSALSLEVADERAAAIQRFEEGDRRITVPLPAVVTLRERSNTPRLAHAASIMHTAAAHIETMTALQISADAARLGDTAALVHVRRTMAPEAQTKGDIATGDPQAAAATLAARLQKRGFI